MTDGEARKLAFGGLIAMAAAMGIGRFVLTPILPAMLQGLGWTKLDGGLIASANFAGYLLGAIGAGSQRLAGQRRLALIAALFVCAVTTGGMGLVSSIEALALFRFIAGAASAFVLVCASALVLERLGAAGKSRFAAVHFAGVGTGIAISAVIVAALLAQGADWRWLWLASGAALLVGAVIAPQLIAPEPRTELRRVPGSGGAAALLLTIAYGLFGFGYVITTTFLVTLVRETAAIRPLEPWIWMIVGAAALPSVTFWQGLSRRIGLLPAFAVAALAEAIGVAASVEWVSPAGAVLAAVMLGGTFMGLTALGLMAGREINPEAPQRTLANLTASFGLGQMIGPTLAGFLAAQTGSLRTPSLVASGALVAAAGFALLQARERRRPAGRFREEQRACSHTGDG